MNDLLKEAIADAKAVRQTAMANAKLALEEASRQLQYTEAWPHISIIRPGSVGTTENYNSKERSDVNVWVKSVIDTFTQHQNIHVSELSIGHTVQGIPL